MSTANETELIRLLRKATKRIEEQRTIIKSQSANFTLLIEAITPIVKYCTDEDALSDFKDDLEKLSAAADALVKMAEELH